MTFQDLLSLLGETYRDPQKAAQKVLSLGLPMAARWQFLLLVSVLTTIIGILALYTLPSAVRSAMQPVSAIATVTIQAGALAIAAGVIHLVGRVTGGRGTFPDALMLMAWLQASLIPVQLVQLVAQGISARVAEIIFFASLALFFWLLVHFVTALHGYRSRLKVLIGILVVMTALGMLLAPLFLPYISQAV